VQVNYWHDRADSYRPMIAMRPDAWSGIQDCRDWLKSLKEPLEAAETLRRQRSVH